MIGDFIFERIPASKDALLARRVSDTSRSAISFSFDFISTMRPLNSDEKVLCKFPENEKVFLVINKNTIEVRTDEKLGKLLEEKYESVMRSRYFGKGGIEIVDSGQLKTAEIEDLIRLSYNLTKEIS